MLDVLKPFIGHFVVVYFNGFNFYGKLDSIGLDEVGVLENNDIDDQTKVPVRTSLHFKVDSVIAVEYEHKAVTR
jgi:hypothetical protein